MKSQAIALAFSKIPELAYSETTFSHVSIFADCICCSVSMDRRHELTSIRDHSGSQLETMGKHILA